MTEQKYPEHEKLQAVKDKSQAIGEFLEWLSSVKQIRFAKWLKDFRDPTLKEIKEAKQQGFKTPKRVEWDVFVQQQMEIKKWLAEFYEIDTNKLETEKRAMLEEIRKANRDADKERKEVVKA